MQKKNEELEIQMEALKRLHEEVTKAQAGSPYYLGSPTVVQLKMSWNKDTGAEQCRASCRLITSLGAFVEAKSK